MSLYTVLQFSPSKSSPGSASSLPRRKIQPSPEKQNLPGTTVILPRNRADTTTEAGLPVKKKRVRKDESILDAQFEVELGQLSQNLAKPLTVSKRIELSYSLVENRRPMTPPGGDFSELFKLFPTTFAAEVVPPYVIIRVRTLPPKPWPFTVGGLPLWLTTDESADCFDRGRTGKGRKALEHIDLQCKEEFSEDILREVIAVFRDLQVKIRDIMWSPGFWRITIPDNTDLKVLPSFVAHQVCFYKFQSEDPNPNPSALRAKVPQGVEYDDTLYATAPNALLRPGIMVSSSLRHVKTDEGVETPHLRAYDPITMDNPFSGSCEGFVLGLGAIIPEEDQDYVLHEWHIFENGDEPVDGSCGSAIFNSDGEVVAGFSTSQDETSSSETSQARVLAPLVSS